MAVHVPWCGKILDSSFYDERWGEESKSALSHITDKVAATGLKVSKYLKQQDLIYCFRSSIRILEDAGQLRRFILVLPDSYTLHDAVRFDPKRQGVTAVSGVVDVSKFSSLTVALMRLRGGLPGVTPGSWSRESSMLGLSIKSQKEATQLAALHGWQIKTVGFGGLGEYPLPIPDDEDILEPDDIDDD